ncbi:hypothetical protein C1X72_15650 [Pseudomonas sp. FW306-2-2C-D06B]|nr:hypothetical protein C1X72_15650 [Pseudomonas sp. FW306-2-2C-D06B]PNA98375.1 hypothetical protein C1X74_11375 [Pseudomonas sp. GW460-5]PNB58833.1 hypothetical protein C1X73_12465 [Pseudomonas sp. FW305-130]POA73665.1 hypothetical protein C1890_27245 [Pseudomonas sp. DP16D-R1]
MLDFKGLYSYFVIQAYHIINERNTPQAQAQRGFHLPPGRCVLCIEILTLLRVEIDALVKGVFSA